MKTDTTKTAAAKPKAAPAKAPMKSTTIDAAGRVMGRVASEAAMALMGKDEATFERHKITGGTVTIVNAGKIKIDPRKLDTVKYAHYSGYPGGLRFETLAKVLEKKGIEEVLRRAVYGMLPPNKLRPEIMKKLSVTE
jgi:large subunit ribosomal protein L13